MKTELHIPTAQEIMTRQVQTVRATETLHEVTDFLLRHELSNAPVVDESGSGQKVLVGFISERDCLEHLSHEIYYGRLSKPQTAATVMKRHPLCVSPDTDVFGLASIFVNHSMRHVPVVDEQQHLLGIVSRRDALRALATLSNERLESEQADRLRPDLRQVVNLRFLARRQS